MAKKSSGALYEEGRFRKTPRLPEIGAADERRFRGIPEPSPKAPPKPRETRTTRLMREYAEDVKTRQRLAEIKEAAGVERFNRGVRSATRFATGQLSRLQSSAYKAIAGGGRKATKKRALGAKRLLQALGALEAPYGSQGAGPGRPRGSGSYQRRYGVGVFEYRKLQAQRKLLYKQYQDQQAMALQRRGLTPEQIQQLQLQRTAEQLQQPIRQPVVPRQYPQQQFQAQPQQFQQVQQMQGPLPTNAAQDEFEFEKHLAETTISPNTQNILDNLRRIQLKSQMDDINMQRVVRERKIVNAEQNLLKARFLFGPDSNKLNPLDANDNILLAKNIFSLENQHNVFAPTGRPSILDDDKTGARLKFF